MTSPQYHLRPNVNAQQARWLAGCTFIDGYLFSTSSSLYLLLEVRLKGADVMPSAQLMYALKPDLFGLFAERKLYSSPGNQGVRVSVDDLKALNSAQRGQLRRLCVLLAMSLRGSLPGARFSTVLHCLQPRACDPLDGVRNHYATSGRAARDVELARRVREAKMLGLPLPGTSIAAARRMMRDRKGKKKKKYNSARVLKYAGAFLNRGCGAKPRHRSNRNDT